MTNKSLFDVKNRIVVITGTSGQLGYEYAKAFLEHGAIVIGLDKVLSKGREKLENKFSKNNFQELKCDITNKTSIESSMIKIRDRFGIPNVLINNAAIDSPPSSPIEENGPFEGYPESSWDNVMNVNLKGTYLCCQVFGGEMAKVGFGSIINISSIYGIVSPDQGLYKYRRKRGENFYKPVAYSVSKSGILNLTRYLSVYWGGHGVRVNTLTLAGVYNEQDEEFLSLYNSRIPIGRMANPDEYCGAVIFLASDASKYMTGSNLVIDGGWTAI